MNSTISEKKQELKDKSIIFIPGSCSHVTNWFDQIKFFEDQGFNVYFISLYDKAPDIKKMSAHLFKDIRRLKEITGIKAEDLTIVCHSMGGMQLLNLISEKTFYEAEDKETYDLIINSKIFFVQVPLVKRESTILILKLAGIVLYPIMGFYCKYLFKKIDRFLFRTKKYFAEHTILHYLKFFTILNHISVLNTFLGTPPSRFFNLIEVYKSWDFLNKFKGKLSDNTHNYHFSSGFPDIFCSTKNSQNFSKEQNANIRSFPWSFHLPMHIVFSQRAFHNWILGNII